MPNGGLALDKRGNLYGATNCGGLQLCNNNNGPGVVFALKRPAKKGGQWQYRLLHDFGAGSDGGPPSGGLVFDGRGDLYGTASGGGKYQGGIVFELVAPTKPGGSWKETILYNFTGGADGSGPNSGLIFDTAGSLYGTTEGGGKFPGGVIFQLRAGKATWNFAVLYNFKGAPDGYDPVSLIFDKSGDLYGATLYGGDGRACQGGCGTVFEVSP